MNFYVKNLVAIALLLWVSLGLPCTERARSAVAGPDKTFRPDAPTRSPDRAPYPCHHRSAAGTPAGLLRCRTVWQNSCKRDCQRHGHVAGESRSGQ
jgi:hypothetical protein